MTIIENRRQDSNAARMQEFYTSDRSITLEDLFSKAFDAGVAAQSDQQAAERQEAMDKARKLYAAQRETEPVAFMPVGPGEMIALLKEQF